MEATARLGNTSGVLKLLAMMREVGDAPPAALYESLLKLANTRFYWDMALALLRDAEADAVPVTGAMLCATLHCCLQADVRIANRRSRPLFANEQGILHVAAPRLSTQPPQKHKTAAARGDQPAGALRAARRQARAAAPHGAHPPPGREGHDPIPPRRCDTMRFAVPVSTFQSPCATYPFYPHEHILISNQP